MEVSVLRFSSLGSEVQGLGLGLGSEVQALAAQPERSRKHWQLNAAATGHSKSLRKASINQRNSLKYVRVVTFGGYFYDFLRDSSSGGHNYYFRCERKSFLTSDIAGVTARHLNLNLETDHLFQGVPQNVFRCVAPMYIYRGEILQFLP